MLFLIRRRQGNKPNPVWLCLGIIAIATTAMLAACRTDPTPTEPIGLPTLPPGITATPARLKQYTNPAAFDLLYPDEWTNLIIRQGIIVFGTQDAINLDNSSIEPTMLVYRQVPDPNLSLEEAMDRFLEIGPLASGFSPVDENVTRKIDTRPAVTKIVDRPKSNDLDAARSIVTAVETSNAHRYIFVATAPTSEFELWQPTFDLMLASVKLNE